MAQRNNFEEKEGKSEFNTARTISTLDEFADGDVDAEKKETPWYGHLHLGKRVRLLLSSFTSSAAIFQTLVLHQSSILTTFESLPDDMLTKEIARWLSNQPPQDQGLLS